MNEKRKDFKRLKSLLRSKFGSIKKLKVNSPAILATIKKKSSKLKEVIGPAIKY